jgi:hypothetical protein
MLSKLRIKVDELDKQSPVKIDKWLDLNSEECKQKDPDPLLTKKWLKIGAEAGFLFVDSLGRIWGRGKDNIFYPYHFDIGNKNYGFRLANMAVS